MDVASHSGFLEALKTESIMHYLGQLDLGQVIHNPWLLGGLGTLALVSLLMRWRLLLVTLLSLAGFVWLLSYVQQQGTNLHSGTDSVLLFVGGGTVVIGVAIYFLFIRSE